MRSLLLIACLAVLALVPACGAPPARPAPAPPAPAAAPSVLIFSPSGDRVIADGRWIVPTDGGAPHRITPGEGQPIFAADGRIARLAPGLLTVDGRRVPLPAIQHPPVADTELRGLWLDLDRLYLHEWHPVKDRAACRIFDRRTAGLLAPAHCLAVRRPITLQAGPGRLLAVEEAGVAGPVLSLLRYTPGAGTRVLRRFDLRPDGAVRLAFAPDGGTVRMVSRCDLTRPRACTGPARLAAPHLFTYDVLDDRIARGLAVPAGAAPGPQQRLAWPTAGGVCVARHPGARGACRSVGSAPGISSPGASRYTPPHVGDDHP